MKYHHDILAVDMLWSSNVTDISETDCNRKPSLSLSTENQLISSSDVSEMQEFLCSAHNDKA